MIKILVVNDSEFERKVCSHLLSKLNYQVEEAEEFQVYNKLNEFEPDVLFINLIMERVSGDELIKVLKTRFPELKCVLSSCNEIKLADYAHKKVDAVLQTPTNQQELAEILDSLVEDGMINNQLNVCSACNNQLENNLEQTAKFCPYCGQSLQA